MFTSKGRAIAFQDGTISIERIHAFTGFSSLIISEFSHSVARDRREKPMRLVLFVNIEIVQLFKELCDRATMLE